jgi:hypothetical protein
MGMAAPHKLTQLFFFKGKKKLFLSQNSASKLAPLV